MDETDRLLLQAIACGVSCLCGSRSDDYEKGSEEHKMLIRTQRAIVNSMGDHAKAHLIPDIPLTPDEKEIPS